MVGAWVRLIIISGLTIFMLWWTVLLIRGIDKKHLFANGFLIVTLILICFFVLLPRIKDEFFAITRGGHLCEKEGLVVWARQHRGAPREGPYQTFSFENDNTIYRYSGTKPKIEESKYYHITYYPYSKLVDEIREMRRQEE